MASLPEAEWPAEEGGETHLLVTPLGAGDRVHRDLLLENPKDYEPIDALEKPSRKATHLCPFDTAFASFRSTSLGNSPDSIS